MKRDANPIESESTCPMCGQPLVDKQAAAHVADYEKRTEARLLGELAPQAIAVAEGKYGGRLAEAIREADDLRRKLEAKSARSRGKEQEDALIARLARAFPEDDLAPIADHGAGDILQIVHSKGQEVGRILHESKNTKAWLNAWVPKIKQDGELRRATRLVIESRCLPRGARGYCERDGVMVCEPDYAEALTHVLRMWMISTHVEDDQKPDEQKLWEYLSGEEFRARLDLLRKATNQEDEALLAEERSHKRWWDARAERVGTIRNAVAGIEGDIREISDAPHKGSSRHGRQHSRSRTGAVP